MMNLRRHQFLLLTLGALLAFSTSGQVSLIRPPPVPTGPRVQGLIYYAVEHRDLQQVVERGTAGANGVAFDRLFLAPDTRYHVWLLEAATLRVSDVKFTSGGVGQTFDLPPFVFHEQSSHDADQDGLPDLYEFVMGTGPLQPDTDGAEVRQGIFPSRVRFVPGQRPEPLAAHDYHEPALLPEAKRQRTGAVQNLTEDRERLYRACVLDCGSPLPVSDGRSMGKESMKWRALKT